jgi:thiol-disulfide isomerase/thioredoxin
MKFIKVLSRHGWLILFLVVVAGCSKKSPPPSAQATDPEIEKLVTGDRSKENSPATSEPASPMVIPPPPAAAAPNEQGRAPAIVQVVDFAGFNKEREAFRGKYLVVDGWATWCGICKEKFPKFLEVESKYRLHDNVVFASIANDPADKEPEVKEFLAQLSSNLRTFVLDEDPADFAATFEVNGVPAYLVYDPEGKIIFRAGKIEELIDKLAELFPESKS